MRRFYLTLRFCLTVLRLVAKHAWLKATHRWRHRHDIQLRDALTGRRIGMTKQQLRRYQLALGSRDPQHIAAAVLELQDRKSAMEKTS